MTIFGNDNFISEFFQEQLSSLGNIFLDSIGGALSDEDTSLGAISEFNNNLIGNNGAIIMTDDAQSTVNFLYVNPISLLNGGRASDVHLTINAADLPSTNTGSDDQDSDPVDSESSSGFNNNVLSNNAAIILSDEAESVVNFLYVNPISLLNSGRASDVYFNYPQSDDAAQVDAADDAGDNPEESFDDFLEDILGTSDRGEALEIAENILDNFVAEDAFSFLDDLDLPDELAFLSDIEFPQPPNLLEILGVADEFEFGETSATEVIGALGESVGENAEINDNVIGNNAAILLTDDAESTVNFIYINPISILNDGRAGDVYLNITFDEDDGLLIA